MMDSTGSDSSRVEARETVDLLMTLAEAPDLPALFELLCERVGRIIHARGAVAIFAFDGDTRLTLVRRRPDATRTPDATRAPNAPGTPDAIRAPDSTRTLEAPRAPDGHPAAQGEIGTYIGLTDEHSGQRYLLALRRCAGEGSFTDEEQTMLASIARLASRIVTMRSRADSAAREQLHEREIAQGSALLSRREAEVVDCLCRGMKTAEIANRFRISPRTIEHHLRHIYRKLRVSGRRELIDALGYDRRE